MTPTEFPPAAPVAPPEPRAVRASEERFRFIDALRGLAALSVVLYHLLQRNSLHDAAYSVIPRFLEAFLYHTDKGVDVFFVISGFVIAYSVRRDWVNGRFLGNFALRRSIRLDPSYWVVLAVVIALNAILAVIYRHAGAERWIVGPPSVPQMLAQLLYLQRILGHYDILGVSWSLCIEVQFYLSFCLLQGAAQRMMAGRSGSIAASPIALTIVFLPLALLSLGFFSDWYLGHVWVTNYFCLFFLGGSACWALESPSRLHRTVFILFSIAVLASTSYRVNMHLCVAAATAITIYVVGCLGHLRDWLSGVTFQYFGRISYSLYLIHAPIGDPIVSLGYALTRSAALPAFGWLAIALFASIGAAHVLHAYVEGPSVRFAKRFKLRPAMALAP